MIKYTNVYRTKISLYKEFFTKMKKFIRDIFFTYITEILAQRNSVLIRFVDKERSEIFRLIRKLKADGKAWITYHEGLQLFMAVKSTEKIKGDIAEVGVYKGGTAKIICKAKGSKVLHLFDTFEGLPDATAEDDNSLLMAEKFYVSYHSVRNYLKNEKRVHFYKGLFPYTAKPIKNLSFSFVHLDVDLYKSTLDCLKFFYPRMNKGGIILSHDYTPVTGVNKAFNEFFANKAEPIIDMSSSQCLVIKV